MLGLGVVLMGAMAGMLVSATPLLMADDPEVQQQAVPDLLEVMKELVISDKNVQEQLLAALENIGTTQENLQRFLLGGSQVNLSDTDITAVESETDAPRSDSNMAFFTRSVVAALNSGNNTQLEAILTEVKSLNDNFKKYFRSAACPEPFIDMGDECFNFQLEDLTWEQSRQRCLKLGGDLAIPKNLTEVRLYIGENFPRKNRRNFWLGGIENNKVWEWLSGDAVNPQLWYTNEPSGNGDCLAMFDGWEHPLSDFPCENERRAICERAIRT